MFWQLIVAIIFETPNSDAAIPDFEAVTLRAPRSERPRRTEGVRVHGRSARVVEEVIRATVEEIGKGGYEALRIEDVAARSGVNKTTIYRRWPTKLDLVAAAVSHFSTEPEPPSTGSLRSDLLTLLRRMAERASSPLGRGIVRMVQLERTNPEVDNVLQRMKAGQQHTRRLVIERAIERGELPRGTDPALLVELVFAPVARRCIYGQEPVEDAFIQAAVDVVIAGARAGAAVRQPAPRKTRARAR